MDSQALSDSFKRIGGQVQLRVPGRAHAALVAGRARAGDGSDLSVDVDAADALVQGVGDVEVALAVKSDAPGSVENRVEGIAWVPTVPSLTSPSDRVDGARRPDVTNDIVAGVGDEERVAEAACEAGWKIQSGFSGGSPIARIRTCATGADSRDCANDVHSPDPIVESVGDVDGAGAVDGQALRHGQVRLSPPASVSALTRRARAP